MKMDLMRLAQMGSAERCSLFLHVSLPHNGRMKNYNGIIRTLLDLWMLIFFAATTFSIAVTQTAYSLALVFWISLMFYQKNLLVTRTPLDYYFLAYLVFGITSSIFAVENGSIVVLVRRFLLIPIVYLVANNVRDEKLLKRLLFTMISLMVVLSVIGIKKYLTGPGGLDGRLRLFHHYMTSGGILMIVSLMTFALAVSPLPRNMRIAAFLSGCIMLAPLLFTFTRSSWLGFVGGIVLIGIIANRKIIAAVLITTVLLFALSPHSMRERAISIFNPFHKRNIERVYMWKAGIKMIKDHPLTGVGDTGLDNIYREYKLPEARENVGHLHSNFLMWAVTLGIPGFVAVLLLFLNILIMELKIYYALAKHDPFLRAVVLGSLAVFVGFQVNGLFEWNFGDSEIVMLLWLSVGLALAANKIAFKFEHNMK